MGLIQNNRGYSSRTTPIPCVQPPPNSSHEEIGDSYRIQYKKAKWFNLFDFQWFVYQQTPLSLWWQYLALCVFRVFGMHIWQTERTSWQEFFFPCSWQDVSVQLNNCSQVFAFFFLLVYSPQVNSTKQFDATWYFKLKRLRKFRNQILKILRPDLRNSISCHTLCFL